MTADASVLPAEFSDLEPFVADWSDLTTMEERYLKRQSMTTARLRGFYDAMVPRLDDVLAHLDTFPLDDPLPAPQEALYRLALGLAEAAAGIEVFGQARVPGAPPDHRVSSDWSDGTR